MDNIERKKEALLTLFPVRKRYGQKAEFLDWLCRELKRAGYKARKETYGKFNGSVNVIAGDPERARIFLMARYDTGSAMPVPNFVSPTNVAAHVLYHVFFALLLIVLAFALSIAVTFPFDRPDYAMPLFVVFFLLGLYLSAFGPANKSNANGNTSGVLTLLALADRIPRDKGICFLFLDNNEKSLLGAKAFKRRHPDAAANGLFLNFDCVGDGEHLLFMPSKYSRWDDKLLAALGECFPPEEGIQPHVISKGLVYYPSDHRKFKYHVAVAACRRRAGIGYYIPHLRTAKDRALRVENVAYLARGMERFLAAYRSEHGED